MFQYQDTISACGQRQIVGCEDGSQVVGPVEALDQVPNAFGAAFVQVSGRLVGEKQRGLIHKRTRDRHSLLFAARKFSRLLPGPVR